MGGLALSNYNALVLINPGEDAKELSVDLVPQPGRTIEGTVLGLDGKPLSGVSVIGLTSHDFDRETLETPHFQVKVLDPKQKRTLVFRHQEKGLGLHKEIRGDEPGPLTVQLERCGAVVGRLLDGNGQPVAGLILHCDRKGLVSMELATRTDREGRFRIDGLVPGQEYNFWYSYSKPAPYAPLQVEPGQVKDLGDAKINPDPPGPGR
jgi:hypothetical protein